MNFKQIWISYICHVWYTEATYDAQIDRQFSIDCEICHYIVSKDLQLTKSLID